MEEAKLPPYVYGRETGPDERVWTESSMLLYGRECARIAVEAERERRAEAALSFVGAAGPFGDPEVVNLSGALGAPGISNSVEFDGIKGGTKVYCCYGMYADMGHDKDCKRNGGVQACESCRIEAEFWKEPCRQCVSCLAGVPEVGRG